jgi:hypothetical protein
MSDKKYSWNYEIKWVVEFVRKDAEIAISFDPYDKATYESIQKIIRSGCPTREEAEKVAIEFCQQLDRKVREFIRREVSGLKTAKE